MKITSPKAMACATVPALGERPEPRDQVLDLLGMARRKQHGMAGLDPQAADRAADMARADDADAQLGATACLRQGVPRHHRRGKGQRAAGAEQRAAGGIER